MSSLPLKTRIPATKLTEDRWSLNTEVVKILTAQHFKIKFSYLLNVYTV